jgi:V/A-type H+-transporting ATPase subunit A
MKGRITGISGPTVTVDIKELKLYDRVTVGHEKLQGEVVSLETAGAIVQVYEDTHGLGVGEPAEGLGAPLAVHLGPGLLGKVFDGLQRPLEQIRDSIGPFITPGHIESPLDQTKKWRFTAQVKPGAAIDAGDIVGHVNEGTFTHSIITPWAGKIETITDTEFTLAQPIAHLEDGRQIMAWQEWPIRQARFFRQKQYPREPLITGQRIIDFLFPIARGGTAIIPGGFGTGKTILEQAIAKYADVDVVVYVGCGERGNEMAELLEVFSKISDPWTGRTLLERTVMVANTSNMPVAAREASIYTAVTMAEYYRDQGYNVLLLADSISRWAEALREISSALEEMPGEEGYPTYLASRLSTFFARAGVVETMHGKTGSLSMILSVSPAGGDFTEPATQACLRTTGVFLMLDTSLAYRRHFPAINWFQSFSLYESDVLRFFNENVSDRWTDIRSKCQALLQREEQLREVAEIVGAEGLQDCDHLVMSVAEKIRLTFLCQNSYTDDAFSKPEQTFSRIETILEKNEAARKIIEQGDPLEKALEQIHL